ncbi:hypothetical protein P7K49_003321 [Saguinus oedipus]|uniref:Mitogen-activated protein kinase n=1 Tax=Saguinus oedipus TaxID=9490 RepID=A0ABQ9WK94_SAGOE|nr:hypothetical protein P7K49_003321 [Saguinus oedipus]
MSIPDTAGATPAPPVWAWGVASASTCSWTGSQETELGEREKGQVSARENGLCKGLAFSRAEGSGTGEAGGEGHLQREGGLRKLVRGGSDFPRWVGGLATSLALNGGENRWGQGTEKVQDLVAGNTCMVVQPQGSFPASAEARGRRPSWGGGAGAEKPHGPIPTEEQRRPAGSACARGPPPTDPSRRRLIRPPSSSAYDARLRQKVAVKKLSRPFQSLIHARRTYRELRLLKHLKHENVSRGRAVGEGASGGGAAAQPMGG